MKRSLGIAAAVFALVALGGAASAAAEPSWAPATGARIQPGNQTVTDGAQCTSNFVFFDASNGVYLGQAAHCAGTGGATETNGCDAGSHPLGTSVEVENASRPARLVYSSWITMQSVGETNPDVCDFNDLGLVKLDPVDAATVNPSMPFWGGPTGITDTTSLGDTVLSYGNSSLRGGIRQLSPKQGLSLGQDGGGWTHSVVTVTPGIPGDSGSAFVDADGRAFGVLSTLQLAPAVGSNGVSDLSRMLAYMRAHGGPQVSLALGTEAFRGPLP